MISIKKTIYATLKDKIKKLRFLGQNDPKGMKKLLSLVAINFVYDWVYFNDTESEYLKQLRDLQTGIILNGCTFKKVNKDLYKNGVIEAFQAYRNVNTPQSNDDWKRVWDAPELTVLAVKGLQPTTLKWTIDPTYSPQVVYFIGVANQPPSINIETKSVHDKMNIYINRNTDEVWYYGTDCQWHKPSNAQGMTPAQVKQLIIENRQGLTSIMEGNTVVTKPVEDASSESRIYSIPQAEIDALL